MRHRCRPMRNRNSGVRRHRAPYLRVTGCDRPQNAPFERWGKALRAKALRRMNRAAVAEGLA